MWDEAGCTHPKKSGRWIQFDIVRLMLHRSHSCTLFIPCFVCGDLPSASRAHPQHPMHHCGRQCVVECLCSTRSNQMSVNTSAVCWSNTVCIFTGFTIPCFGPSSTRYCASITFLQCEHHSSDRQGEEQFVGPIMTQNVWISSTLGHNTKSKLWLWPHPQCLF